MTESPQVKSHHNNFNLIRLVAAIQVLLVHAVNHFGISGPVPTALKAVPGVPTFFFISGVLICHSYERTRPQGNKVFFLNRALRIFPALYACVAIATLSVFLTGYFAHRSVGLAQMSAWLAGQLTIFQFYNPPFMREYGVGVLNGALWTITVELQFYVLAPLLYFLMRRRPLGLLLVFSGSLLLNLFFRFRLNWDLLWMKLAYVSFIPWVYMFIIGFLVAGSESTKNAIRKYARLRLLIPVYLATMILFGGYDSNASNEINPISFLILAAMLMRASAIRILVFEKLQQFIRRNDFSYGLYLYHMPVINLLLYTGTRDPAISIASTLLIAAVAAVASWYLVEKPALSHKS